MPGTPPNTFILRLLLAALLGVSIPWFWGPTDNRYRVFAISLGILAILGGLIRDRTKEGGLMGEMATGALALLMLAPAVGVRAGRVSDAIFTATHIAPHEALFQLPAIAQTVPNASGPLLVGAGFALLAVAGRLGAVYAGIALGAATAAWIGQTLAIEAGEAMRAERFEEAVLFAQAMRFVGIASVVGAVIGFPFYRRGKTAWRTAMTKVIHDHRMTVEQAKRDTEIARVEAAHAELKSREAAEEAARIKAEEEAAAGGQGVTIDDLEEEEQKEENDAVEAAPEAPAHQGPQEGPPDEDEGEGGGFGEEDSEFEEDPDEQETEVQKDARADGSAEVPDHTPPPLELEPRFDIESPIVITVLPEESDPNKDVAPDAMARMRRMAGGLIAVAILTAAWTATPPWFEVLNALPDPGTHVAVPSAEPGLSIARSPMDPLHAEFDDHLQNRGHGRLHGAAWSCLNDTANFGMQYGSLDRAIEVLAVPSDTPVVDLYESVKSMRRRGVYKMGLTGRANPPYGPLGALFAWPAVELLLDRPPRAALWMHLNTRSIEELPLVPGRGMPRACVLLIDDQVKVNHLYNTVRSLSSTYGDKRCQRGIALVFPEDGTTTNENPAWRGCP